MRAALGFDIPPRPSDMSLSARLKGLLLDEIGEKALDAIEARDRRHPLTIDRIDLADVLACEANYVETKDVPFEYTPQKARGSLAGTMLRRWYFRDQRPSVERDWNPVEAIHEVLDELSEQDDKLGRFIAGLSSGGRADVAAGVLDVVHAFEEGWPLDIDPKPVRAHSSLRSKLFGGRLILTYKVGFKFGQPRPQGGVPMSSVVLFDVRPGREYEEEERYNRWYAALLELFQVGVAPLRVVTWYAESQHAVADTIDEGKLEAAARRVAGGVRRMAELAEGRPPAINPGWRCRYCPLGESCTEGAGWIQDA